ncbi:MAG: hypothetical protein C4582_05350 [Desulfobacteraceae bacterium]|nr:MAG: hypothetical protein C4582_05350 [Desulfobacteraceae bacterium]
MNPNAKTKFIGCAAFGLGDLAASSQGSILSGSDFCPSVAILPGRPNGIILTGEQAKASREHSGLPWPPEAWIKQGDHLRRVPIFGAWRSLVEARDRHIRWEVGGGVSFSVARILAAHIANLLIRCQEETEVPVTISIPDDLDEYGQESLINELNKEFDRLNAHFKVRLLWRPVGAALAWLEEAGGDMKKVVVERNPEDFFIVLYLGVDSIECASFRIKIRADKKGLYYVVPRRERPKGISPLAGYDWAGNVLEKIVQENGEGAFWQALVSFPDIWETLAGRRLTRVDPPRIWGLEKSYCLWEPDSNQLSDIINTVKCGPSKMLREVQEGSCKVNGTIPCKSSWSERIAGIVHERLKTHEGGRLVGMIVCGPLTPPEPPSWLSSCFPELESRGLDTRGPWDLREANRLWISPGETAIAQGCAIFQKRLQECQPTYLDTLPQYFLIVRESGGIKPFPLVDQQDVEGGDKYDKTIVGKFKIEKNTRKLDIVISRHSSYEEVVNLTNVFDELDRQLKTEIEGLSKAEASLVRHFVREAKDRYKALRSLESNRREFGHFESAFQYAERFAALWYESKEDRSSAKPQLTGQREHLERSDTQFRSLSFPFSIPAPDEMPVDLHMRIKPASGMAHLEIIPEKESFLRGRPVFVDYRTMRPFHPEEFGGRGWPPLDELTPHPDPSIWINIDGVVSALENPSISTDEFFALLNQVYDFFKTRKQYISGDNSIRYLPVLSQDGVAGCQKGEELVLRISKALQLHTSALGAWNVHQINSLITRATWLYGLTPENVLNRVREDISRHPRTPTLEAASRAMMEQPDLTSIFESIVEKVDLQNNLVIQCIRASKNILSYRSNGQNALNDKTTIKLFNAVLGELRKYSDQNNYQSKFFVSLTLLLYLLRYRKVNERFLLPKEQETKLIENDLYNFMEKMKKWNVEKKLSSLRVEKAESTMKGIIDYLDYSGNPNVITILAELSED